DEESTLRDDQGDAVGGDADAVRDAELLARHELDRVGVDRDVLRRREDRDREQHERERRARARRVDRRGREAPDRDRGETEPDPRGDAGPWSRRAAPRGTWACRED